jgi:hypothetical protein
VKQPSVIMFSVDIVMSTAVSTDAVVYCVDFMSEPDFLLASRLITAVNAILLTPSHSSHLFTCFSPFFLSKPDLWSVLNLVLHNFA